MNLNQNEQKVISITKAASEAIWRLGVIFNSAFWHKEDVDRPQSVVFEQKGIDIHARITFLDDHKVALQLNHGPWKVYDMHSAHVLLIDEIVGAIEAEVRVCREVWTQMANELHS